MGTKILRRIKTTVLLFTGLLVGAVSAHAVNLAAVEARWTPPDSAAPITMWGFIADPGSCPSSPVSWDLGPQQIGTAGGALTINLRNCLNEDVSLVIPGLNATLSPVINPSDTLGRSRATSFAKVATANGGTASYTWTNLKSGTFIYQSGANPAKQVQMGLYGAVVIGPAPADVAGEVMVFYSEIDPALHSPPVAATPLTYKPKYYLINGEAYSPSQAVSVVSQNTSQSNILIRFCNAGLMSHMPVIQGEYMTVLAEDGNPLPFERQQYSVHLSPGKTYEAAWRPQKSGKYAIYDRRLSLTSDGAVGGGLLTYIDVRFPWPMFVPAMSKGGHN